jgi:CelD/BcsL family acetyltransferase involved in cellulose biosynthesis
MEYRDEIVTTAERLDAIAPAWEALWRAQDGLAFQDPEWVRAWWRTDATRSRRALRIGLLWRGDALAAVLPFALVRRVGVRIFEWAGKDHCDFGDVLIHPDCDPERLSGLWRRLMAEGGFDIAYVNRLLPDAAALDLIRHPSAGVAFAPAGRSESNYRVGGGWPRGAAWLEAQPKKVRQNYRRCGKLLAAEGETRFRLLDPKEPLGPLMERFAALKRDWLARHGLRSDLYDEGSPALEALVAVLAKRGVLHLFVLECDGRPIAISVNFVQRGVMMAFVTTYDPAYERCSPGMLLMIDYILWAFDRGLEEVDFLSGGEDFKRRFASRGLELASFAAPRTPLGRLALWADGALRRFKTWREERAARLKAPADATAAPAAPAPSRQ